MIANVEFEGADDLIRTARMIEVVLPAVRFGTGPGRTFGTRLAQHLAQPVDARPGHVAGDRPDRPVLGRGPQRELLGREVPDRFDETPLVLRPAVVEEADRHPLFAFMQPTPPAFVATSPMIAASSAGRDHIGQWLVGRSIQVTSWSSGSPARNAQSGCSLAYFW